MENRSRMLLCVMIVVFWLNRMTLARIRGRRMVEGAWGDWGEVCSGVC